MTPRFQSSSYYGSYTPSNSIFGNQPSVNINPNNTSGIDNGFIFSLSASSTGVSKTWLMVSYVSGMTASEQILFGIRGSANTPRILSNVKSTTNEWWSFYNNVSGYNTGFTFPSYQYTRIDYNYTSGNTTFYHSSANTFLNLVRSINGTASQNWTNTFAGPGWYGQAYGTTPRLIVVEVILINGIPTDTELNRYSDYIANKYNANLLQEDGDQILQEDGYAILLDEPSVTPTPTITQTNTPSITPSITPTNTNTPSVTPTEPYDVYQFEECNNPSNVFRYENVPGILTTGTTYEINGGSGFNGFATVVNYTGTGTLYSSTGTTFTVSSCPTPTPTPTITQTLTPSGAGATNFLLQEDGDQILQEDGDNILLEQ